MTPSVTSINSGFPMLPVFLLIVVYVFFALSLGALARKTGFSDIGWWGWVPVMQVLLVLKMAGVQWWWIFFFLIPVVNIGVGIYVWINITKKIGKHPIWGVLMIVPGVDLAVLGYLAFSK